MWFIALLIPAAHGALTDERSGPSFDLAAGGGFTVPPALGSVSGLASIGWWAGTYDDSYAIGRYWSVNLNQRVDWEPKANLRLAPSLELRRGLDLVVVGWYVGIGGGPVLVPESQGLQLGAGGRAVFGGEFRRTRFAGLTLRFEGGADVVSGQVVGAFTSLLGFQFSRPGDGKGVH